MTDKQEVGGGCPDCGESMNVVSVALCESHRAVLGALAGQRMLSEGQRDHVAHIMVVGVASFMGSNIFDQYGGCPVCVLEGTLERACDEVSMIGRKSN